MAPAITITDVGGTTEFGEAVQDVLAKIVEPTPDTGGKEYVMSPERAAEANLVEPCTARFISAELSATENREGVGRYAPKSFAPPLGVALGRRLRKLGGDERSALRAP